MKSRILMAKIFPKKVRFKKNQIIIYDTHFIFAIVQI